MSNNYWRKLLEKKWCLAMICWAQRLALLSLSLSHTRSHPSLHPHTHSHSLTHTLSLSHTNTDTHTMSCSHTHTHLINSSFSHLNVAFCFFAINSSLKEKTFLANRVKARAEQNSSLIGFKRFNQHQSIDILAFFSNWTGCQKRGRPLLSQGGNFRNTCDNVDKLDCWYKLSKANN